MAQLQENAKSAIKALQSSQTEVLGILKDHSDNIKALVNNRYNQMITALTVAAGVSDNSSTTITKTPLKKIAGRNLEAKPNNNVAAAAPAPKEVAKVTDQVNEAFDLFPSMQPADILTTFSDLVIRGVAVKAGMAVTPTEPAALNTPFVATIVTAVTDKIAAIEADKKAKEAAAKPAVDPSKDGAPDAKGAAPAPKATK